MYINYGGNEFIKSHSLNNNNKVEKNVYTMNLNIAMGEVSQKVSISYYSCLCF